MTPYSTLSKTLQPLLGLAVGLVLALGLTVCVGENPWQVFKVIVISGLGSFDDLALTLFYSTSLIFTGLSVAIAFQVGLFNIGAEGQLLVSTLAVAALGPLLQHLPFAVFLPLMIFIAGASGFLWGLIPGWIRAYRGGHEVVITMMLNFIAAGLANYFVVGVLQNPDSQSPETSPIQESSLLRTYDPLALIFPDTAFNGSFLLAISLCVGFAWILKFTRFGFQLRSVSANANAARNFGINVRKIQLLALAIAGAVAGLVAINEVLGNSGRFRLGFSADFGFVGIAVALLARNNPIGVIFSALLFGLLLKGTGDLDIETEFITRDFSRILQAVIILSISVISIMPVLSFRKRGNRD